MERERRRERGREGEKKSRRENAVGEEEESGKGTNEG